MQEYLYNDGKKRRTVALLATILYVALWLAMMVLIQFGIEEQRPQEPQGIVMDFGDAESARGNIDTPLAQQNHQPSSSQPASAAENILTQDHEPSVEMESPKPKQRNDKTDSQTNTRTNNSSSQERPRQVNPQTLFPGNTVGSTSTSQGTGEGKGNQGAPTGELGGNAEGTGGSGASGTANLAGRNIVGSLPRPQYGIDERGRVIIDIIVDKNGNVTSATFNPVNSTTQNATLVDAARKAALKAKFTPSQEKEIQQGTITYNFKLK